MANNYFDEINKVFFNKLGISNNDLLRKIEYEHTSLRGTELIDNPGLIKSTGFGFERQKEIHRHLFQDIYEWAGQERTTSLSKGNDIGQITIFAKPEQIQTVWKDIERKATDFSTSNNLNNNEKINALADIFISINYAHAFPEGNGRTTQIFMQQLAKTQSIELDFSRVEKNEWNLASSQSSDVYRRFEGHLIPIPTDNSKIYNAFAKISGQMLKDNLSASGKIEIGQIKNAEHVGMENHEKMRVVVMNKSHLLEAEENGKWVIQKVSQAPEELKPGVYLLHTAKVAAEGSSHAGQIIYKDDKAVYQKSGMSMVKHAVSSFEKVPEIGETLIISLSQGKAQTKEMGNQKTLKH